MSLIRSGTWEFAEGSSQYLQYEDQEARKSQPERQVVVQVDPLPRPPVLTRSEADCLSSQFLSEVEVSLLNSVNPLELEESGEITVLGNRGVWTNRDEVSKFRGDLNEYSINEDSNPQVINKKVEKNITKHYYRCNKVKQRSPRQCSTGLVLILKAQSQEVELHRRK